MLLQKRKTARLHHLLLVAALQVKYPDLRYHEAIYWSVVTATTIGGPVGYGP